MNMYISCHAKWSVILGIQMAALILLGASGLFAASSQNSATAAFTLWQLPEQTASQMMSYVIRTNSGRLIVIDGGMKGDAPYLRGFLGALGNKVDAWFITHPHPDHVDALTDILRQPGNLKIARIYASSFDEDWVRQNEPGTLPTMQAFNAALKDARRTVIQLRLGTTLRFDNVAVEILGVRNPEITANAGNNSCAVLRVSDGKKSVLFLGDLGVEGGNKLLNGKYKDRLRSDYVQMAHHGQNGVGEDAYKIISPSYCLWPTPIWLWENNSGNGKGSGPWRTLEVRAWMDKLNIKKHYITGVDGLSRID